MSGTLLKKTDQHKSAREKQKTQMAASTVLKQMGNNGGASPKVYAAGYYEGGPCYWENGVKTDLSACGADTAATTSIVVSGGSVYTAGHYLEGGVEKACYWKDGVRAALPAGVRAHGIAIVE